MGLDRASRLRGRVHDHDLVGEVDEGLRHGLRRRRADNTLDEFLLLRNVGQVDGRDDGDARVEELFDVLVPVRMAAAWRVVVGEVASMRKNATPLRPAREQRISETSITGTPPIWWQGRISSARTAWAMSGGMSGCTAATTTSSPRSWRRRPSSNRRNDLPTPDA